MLKVSTVIVTFNRLPLLKECIAAVKAQDYPIYQITVVNNKSTDGTLEYLTELCSDAQMKIVNLSENIGGAGGFNIIGVR